MNIAKQKEFLKIGIVSVIIIFIIYLSIPLSTPLFKIDYSQIVTTENGELLRVFLNRDEQWCLPPSVTDQIPEKLKEAIVNFEDQFFYWHPGINLVSLVKAVYQNISEKRIVRGGSTITMQVARLINKNPRTIFNKILEIFLAFKIEVYYSKEEILKLYLEHAPFGGNIIGYSAASQKYFKKPPKELSWAEAATLAVLPNAPGLVTPASSHSILKVKRDKLLKILFDNNKIDEPTYKLAKLEPIISKVYPFKSIAAHLSQKIVKDDHNRKVFKTTINIGLQQYLELIVKQYSSIIQKEGIRNCAVLVVETKSGKVKGYIGSQNYFDKKNNGMVDGVMAARSSGSILKPFLYALSIDEGIIIPQTLIRDIPSYFNAFAPQNADEKYSGVVTAKEALINSLNIPAVRLLNTYGVLRFYSFLRNAGLTTLFRSAEDYGLPLIIGGAEVNLFEMTALFRGLANNGKFTNSYYLIEDSLSQKSTTTQLISTGACYLTLNMLKELNRPGVEQYWQQFQNQKPIAWKTGTSYGSKDAWAIGVSPDWTIGVWVGNFDGEPNHNLSGNKSAGTLLFEIFNYLPKLKNNEWFEKIDPELRTVEICKSTGFLAGPYCDEKENADVPVNMFPLKLCPFHKNVFIDKKSGYAVCSNCWGNNYEEKHVLSFPSEVNYYLRLRGQIIDEIPIHNPECSKISDISPIMILYPTAFAKIWLPYDYNRNQQKLIVRLAHNRPENNIFWYIDNKYLGSTNHKHEKALELSKGWHNLFVIDENGYNDKVKFFINKSEME